jgi:hypothetical protein
VPTSGRPDFELKVTGGDTSVWVNRRDPKSGKVYGSDNAAYINIEDQPTPQKPSQKPDLFSFDPGEQLAGGSVLLNGQNFSTAGCVVNLGDVLGPIWSGSLGNVVEIRQHDEPHSPVGTVMQHFGGPLSSLPVPPSEVLSSTQLRIDLPATIAPGRYDMRVTRNDGPGFTATSSDWVSFTVTPSQFALRFRYLKCVLDTSEGGEDEIIVDAFGAGDGSIFRYRTPGNDDMIFSTFEGGDVFPFPPDVTTVFPVSGPTARLSQGLVIDVGLIESDAGDIDGVKSIVGFSTDLASAIATAAGKAEYASVIKMIGGLVQGILSLFAGTQDLGRQTLGWNVQELLHATDSDTRKTEGVLIFSSNDPEEGFEYRLFWELERIPN